MACSFRHLAFMCFGHALAQTQSSEETTVVTVTSLTTVDLKPTVITTYLTTTFLGSPTTEAPTSSSPTSTPHSDTSHGKIGSLTGIQLAFTIIVVIVVLLVAVACWLTTRNRKQRKLRSSSSDTLTTPVNSVGNGREGRSVDLAPPQTASYRSSDLFFTANDPAIPLESIALTDQAAAPRSDNSPKPETEHLVDPQTDVFADQSEGRQPWSTSSISKISTISCSEDDTKDKEFPLVPEANGKSTSFSKASEEEDTHPSASNEPVATSSIGSDGLPRDDLFVRIAIMQAASLFPTRNLSVVEMEDNERMISELVQIVQEFPEPTDDAASSESELPEEVIAQNRAAALALLNIPRDASERSASPFESNPTQSVSSSLYSRDEEGNIIEANRERIHSRQSSENS